MNLWQSYLNAYSSIPHRCEKPWGLISEPIDTVSNIAIFISAYFIFKLLKENKLGRNLKFRVFAVLVLSLGIGSTIYHAFHSPYTAIADLLPIYIFVFYSLYLFLSLITKNKMLQYGIPGLLFILQVAFRAGSLPLFVMNMPTFHIFNVFFILALSLWGYKKIGNAIIGIFPILIAYAIGIFIRSFDLVICSVNGIGTHFLWHICVAFAIYYTARFLINLSNKKLNL